MMYQVHVHKKGFSMIEMLLYVALTAIIVGGVIAGVYPIFSGTENSFKRVNADTEAAFLVQKIIWALNRGGAIEVPALGESGAVLRIDDPSGDIIFSLSSGKGMMGVGLGQSKALTSSRTVISDLNFEREAAQGGLPESITFDFKVNNREIGPITRYDR